MMKLSCVLKKQLNYLSLNENTEKNNVFQDSWNADFIVISATLSLKIVTDELREETFAALNWLPSLELALGYFFCHSVSPKEIKRNGNVKFVL